MTVSGQVVRRRGAGATSDVPPRASDDGTRGASSAPRVDARRRAQDDLEVEHGRPGVCGRRAFVARGSRSAAARERSHAAAVDRHRHLGRHSSVDGPSTRVGIGRRGGRHPQRRDETLRSSRGGWIALGQRVGPRRAPLARRPDLVEERVAACGSALDELAGQLKVHGERDQVLLDAVVEPALDRGGARRRRRDGSRAAA